MQWHFAMTVFNDFAHPLVHELMDKNDRFRSQYGNHARWDWDDDASTLTFTDATLPSVRIEVSVVGTTEGTSWEWTWANANFPHHTKRDIEKVREYGEVNGLNELTTAFLEADEDTGWTMTAIAAHILDAPGAYRFPRDEGGYCYLIYRRIQEISR